MASKAKNAGGVAGIVVNGFGYSSAFVSSLVFSLRTLEEQSNFCLMCIGT